MKLSFDDFLSSARWRSTTDNFYFRGQGNPDWGLVPSLFRDKRGAPLDRPERERRLARLDRHLIIPFERMLDKILTQPFLQEAEHSRFHKIALAQHFGLPTPGLDWTRSPLVALFMAIQFQSPDAEAVRLFTLDRDQAPDEIIFIPARSLSEARPETQMALVSFVTMSEDKQKLDVRAIGDFEGGKASYHECKFISHVDIAISGHERVKALQELANYRLTIDELFPNSIDWAVRQIWQNFLFHI